jgi:hypothetical protein
MPPKKGTPGKGACQRPDSFSYCPVAHGLKATFSAWLAGEPYWAEEAHEHTKDDPGTKPCLHWLTDGELKCPRCRRARPVKCIGWVPLYREIDSRPVVVIVHESASDLLAGLRHPATVLVGRIGPKDSVFVRRADTQVTFKSEKQTRMSPIDITNDLLMMWNMPEYNEWLRGQRVTALTQHVKQTEEPKRSDGKPFDPFHRNAAVRYSTPDVHAVGELADDAVKAAVARTSKPSKNGHHKPSGEGS